MKTVLLIGNKDSVFIKDFIEELSQDFKFTLLNLDFLSSSHLSRYQMCYDEKKVNVIDVYQDKKITKLSKFSNVFRWLFTNMNNFDIVNVHYLEILHLPLFFLNRRCKLIVTIYGSDILRQSKKNLKLQEPILRRADIITLETKELVKNFRNLYHNKFTNKIEKIGIGNLNIDYFNKQIDKYTKSQCLKRFDFPLDKIIIHIGYNARPEQQHLLVVEQLSTLDEDTKKKIFIVIHVSYGGDNVYIDKINRCCLFSGIQYVIYKNFLDNEEMLCFRNSCDIFINVQTTDVFSSSMIEYLLCGSRMIQGSWLKYDELNEMKGILKIDKLSQVNISIKTLLNAEFVSISKYNRKLAMKLMSWECKKNSWIDILGG